MATPKDKAAEVKRITDFVEPVSTQFEGERIKSEDILGEDIKVLDFALLTSTQGAPDPNTHEMPKFLVIQFERVSDGKLYTTTSGAAQVVAALSQMPKQYLPVLIKIIKDFNEKTKRNFYRVE